MLVLGVDQALRHVGVCLLRDDTVEVVRTIHSSKRTGAKRLAYIRDELLQHMPPDLQLLVLEGYSFQSVNRAFDLGEAGGMVRLLAHDRGVPYLVIPPTTLKLYVTGNGAATKQHMIRSTLQRWSLDISDDNACDAHGLARLGIDRLRHPEQNIGAPKKKSRKRQYKGQTINV